MSVIINSFTKSMVIYGLYYGDNVLQVGLNSTVARNEINQSEASISPIDFTKELSNY